MTTLQRAEAAEHALSQELDRVVVKSVLFTSGERDPRQPVTRPPDDGRLYMMGHDPRLPKMPDRPTLFDFFRLRFGPSTHLMQSARLAMKNGVDEKIVLACLLHDIAIAGFIRSDHGYWGAQLVEPQVADALMQTLMKGLRATQLYLPSNPVYQQAIQNVRTAFAPVWEETDTLTLAVTESDLVYKVVATARDPEVVQVHEVMTKPCIVVNPDLAVEYVARLFASQHAEGTVYAVFNNHKNADFKPYLMKSTDKGATWLRMNDNAHQFGGLETLIGDMNVFGRLYTGGGGIIYWEDQSVSGISDISVSPESVNIYPNPSSSVFRVKLENPDQIVRVAVYDMLGQQVENVGQSEIKSEVTLGAELKPNIYLIQVSGSNFTKSLKVIKK